LSKNQTCSQLPESTGFRRNIAVVHEQISTTDSNWICPKIGDIHGISQENSSQNSSPNSPTEVPGASGASEAAPPAQPAEPAEPSEATGAPAQASVEAPAEASAEVWTPRVDEFEDA
jgi:hypothetical protein